MHIPKLGEQVPQRGNRVSKWIGRVLLHLFRWHIEGEFCQAPKFLFVMAPHTSWWDFTNNFAVLLSTGLNASWFIANKYTKGVLGSMFAYFGAIEVERKQHSDMVTQMVNAFNARDKLLLAIFPEGTRKPVTRWKTGFWYIAKQAKIPIQLVAVDYGKRATVLGPIIQLSDDAEKDIQHMREYFKSVKAKYPEKVAW